MNPDVAAELKDLDAPSTSIEAVLDLRRLRARDRRLSTSRPRRPTCGTTRRTRRRSPASCPTLQGELNRLEELRARLDDLAVLFELAEDEADADTLAEAAARARRAAARRSSELEVRTLLSGEYDAREALVTIRAEAGGVDAADFAEMLLRMYLRWAERHGYPTEVYDTSYAEEAGHQVGHLRRSRRPTPTARSRSSRAPTGWSGSARSTTRAAGRPRSPASRCCRWSSRPTTSRSPRTTSGSTSTARPAPAARASTPPTRRCGSPTSRPASWCPARTSGRSSRTRPPRCACCRPSCSSASARRSRPRWTRSRTTRRLAGATRCAPTCCTRTRWSRTCAPSYETGNPSAVFDGEIDEFIEAGIRWRKQRQTAAVATSIA